MSAHDDIIELLEAGKVAEAEAVLADRQKQHGVSGHDAQILEAIFEKARAAAKPSKPRAATKTEAPPARGSTRARPSVSRSRRGGR